jgi:hypothetical protein
MKGLGPLRKNAPRSEGGSLPPASAVSGVGGHALETGAKLPEMKSAP